MSSNKIKLVDKLSEFTEFSFDLLVAGIVLTDNLWNMVCIWGAKIDVAFSRRDEFAFYIGSIKTQLIRVNFFMLYRPEDFVPGPKYVRLTPNEMFSESIKLIEIK